MMTVGTQNVEVRNSSRLAERAGVGWAGGPLEPTLLELLSLKDWSRFVPESLGLIALILLFRAWLPDISSNDTLPHPLWLPVLLMSGQYGIIGGLFATLTASAALFASGLPPQSAMQDFYAYAGVIATQPCAWFATALLLGGLRSLHMQQSDSLKEQLGETNALAEDLANGLESAVSEIDLLEHRIAADFATVSTVMLHLADLNTTDRSSLMESSAELIRLVVGATTFTIYLDGPRGLEPVISIKDGSRVASTTVQTLPSTASGSVLTSCDDRANDDDDQPACAPFWAAIRLRDAPRPLGMVYCSRLEPACSAPIARRRLNDVCRVLAVFLAVCPAGHEEVSTHASS